LNDGQAKGKRLTRTLFVCLSVFCVVVSRTHTHTQTFPTSVHTHIRYTTPTLPFHSTPHRKCAQSDTNTQTDTNITIPHSPTCTPNFL